MYSHTCLVDIAFIAKKKRFVNSGKINNKQKYERQLVLIFLPNTKNLFCYNISCIVTSMMFVKSLLQVPQISAPKKIPFCYTVKNDAIIASMK